MKTRFKSALAVLALALAGHAAAQVTFYEREDFQGRSFTTDREVGNFARFGFNDRASSVVVQSERWEVCEDVRYGGRCVVLRPGQYPSLSAMGLGERVSSVRAVERDGRVDDNRNAPASEPAQVTFYEHANFQGRSFTTDRQIGNFERFGFNDRASSVVVQGERWEACEDVRFGGRCVVLRPGQYPSLAAMRLSDRVTSVRNVSRDVRVEDNRYAPVPRDSQIIFYERDGFEGQSLTVDDQLEDMRRSGFNDRASSVMVIGQRWEICEDIRFQGRCVVLRPGRYTSLAAMGLSDRVSSARVAHRDERADTPPAPPAAVAAQVVFYEREGFEGRLFAADTDVDNFGRTGFNDRASSVVVLGGRWEACSEAGFRGRCVVLRPGRYPSLSAMGMNNSVSSVRTVRRDAHVDDNQYAPAPVALYDYGRRNDERLYEVSITSARAVVGTAEQRCWVERERVVQNSGNANVGGAIAGALIGGILGHQVGGGTGKDVATFGGAVAGAVVGSNVGRDAQGHTVYDQNVQRCSSVSGPVTPTYWDVHYNFRGQEHRVQMLTQPGPSITVNERGEPRV